MPDTDITPVALPEGRLLRDEPDAKALGVVTSLPLTNCGGSVFTTKIQLNDDLTLNVAVATSVSGLWLVDGESLNGDEQDGGNQTIPTKTNLTQDIMNTTLSLDNVEYTLPSVFATGNIQIGTDFNLSNHVYTRLAAMPPQVACPNLNGVMGLGRSLDPQGVLQSLASSTDPFLRNDGVYSLYTTADSTADEGVLFLGGTDQRHYQNCLDWHDVGEFRKDHAVSDAWEVILEGVSVGRDSLPDSDLAMIDSSVYNLVGPPAAIEKIAQVNQLTCVALDASGAPDYTECDWNNQTAMEKTMFVVDCDNDQFQPVVFNIGTKTYTLTNTDLVTEEATPHFAVCYVHLQVASTDDDEGWTLGGVFLNAYYTVLDAPGKRIGLAKSSKLNQEVCPPDWEYDLRYNGTAWEDPTPAPVTQPPKPPPHAVPTVAPKSSSSSDTDDSNGGGAIGGIMVVGVLFFLAVCWNWSRGSERRRRRQEYHRTSSYQDEWVGDMELT